MVGGTDKMNHEEISRIEFTLEALEELDNEIAKYRDMLIRQSRIESIRDFMECEQPYVRPCCVRGAAKVLLNQEEE